MVSYILQELLTCFGRLEGLKPGTHGKGARGEEIALLRVTFPRKKEILTLEWHTNDESDKRVRGKTVEKMVCKSKNWGQKPWAVSSLARTPTVYDSVIPSWRKREEEEDKNEAHRSGYAPLALQSSSYVKSRRPLLSLTRLDVRPRITGNTYAKGTSTGDSKRSKKKRNGVFLPLPFTVSILLINARRRPPDLTFGYENLSISAISTEKRMSDCEKEERKYETNSKRLYVFNFFFLFFLFRFFLKDFFAHGVCWDSSPAVGVHLLGV